MFLLTSIWKRLSAALIIALFIGAGLFGTTSTASAAGEQYSWTDASSEVISAENGSYSAPIELKKGTPDSKGIPFTGDGQIVCGASTAAASITIYVDPASYKKSDPTPAKSLALISSCTSSTFDANPQITASKALTGNSTTNQTKACDQGALSWIVCPLINNVSETITGIASGILTNFLTVNTISESTTPGLYQTWLGLKNFAEVIFILVFIVVIFSTAIGSGLDQYTIKRLLPRIIASAILVQFSFFISAFIIDLGNILGGGVGDLVNIATAGAPQDTPGGIGLIGDIPAVLALIVGGVGIWVAWPLILPAVVMLFISLLAILFTFAARYILIAILVVISPLAFVAWVLPNTDRYFKQWYTTFIRLILMYPIIVGILTLGGRVNEILAFGGDTTTNGGSNLLVDIIRPFILILAFAMIPRTFKWAGGAMNMASNTFNGLSKRGKSAIRDSDSYKRRKDQTEGRKVDRMRALSDKKAVKNLTNTSTPGIFGTAKRAAGNGFLGASALAMGGAPSNRKAIEQRYGKNFRTFDKELDDLNEIKPNLFNEALMAYYGTGTDQQNARKKVLEEAPLLMDYLKTSTGRAAILARSNARHQFNGVNFRQIADANPVELERMLRTASKNNFREKINVFGSDFSTVTGPGQSSDITAAQVFKSMSRNWKAKAIADDIDVSVFADATGAQTKDASGRTIFTPDARSQSFAAAIAEGSSLAYAGAFDPKSRTPLDKGKKIQILQMLAHNKAIFDASVNGRNLRDSILNEVRKNGNEEIYDDFLIDGMGQTSYVVNGLNNPQKLTEIERLIK